MHNKTQSLGLCLLRLGLLFMLFFLVITGIRYCNRTNTRIHRDDG